MLRPDFRPTPPATVRRARVLACLLGVAACGDGPVEPADPVATTISVVPNAVGLSSIGASLLLDVTVLDQNGEPMAADPAWTSTDPGVAAVSAGGLVTAVGEGTTDLVAVSGSAEVEVPVTVAQEVASVLLEADSIVLADPGDAVTLSVVVTDAGGTPLTSPHVAWTSTAPGVATVDADGHVSAVSSGTTTVVAAAGTRADSLAVRVAPRLVLVAVGDTAPGATVGTEISLSVRVEDEGGQPYPGADVSWSVGAGSGSISSSAASRSDPTGHAGAVWRLGTAAGAQTARAEVVTRGDTLAVDFQATAAAGPAVSATLFADTVLLSAVGETAFLSPTFRDGFGNVTSGSGVVWTSRDPGTVSVAADGLLTGAGVGSARVVGTFGASVDSLEVSVVERGAITITFDDGWRSVYDNAWPVFQDFGFAANVGVYTQVVGAPAFMTEAQLTELHDAGWSMVSHSVTHDTLPNLSDNLLQYELTASQTWIEDRGFHGSNVLIVPYHEYDDRVRLAAGAHYAAVRGISADRVTPDSMATWKPVNPYLLTGIDAERLPFTTQAGRDRLRAMLQRTADEGLFLDVYFHRVEPSQVAAFRATLEVLDEFRDRVLPYHELFPIWARGVF